jgi:putative spermidine/putrescine transport system permease protein
MVLRGTYAEVNEDAEQAARALGASPLETFYHVTLPQIRPGLVASFILTFRTALTIFGTVLVLQSLTVATLRIHHEIANGFELQTAAAIGVIYFVFMLGFTYLGLQYTSAEVTTV